MKGLFVYSCLYLAFLLLFSVCLTWNAFKKYTKNEDKKDVLHFITKREVTHYNEYHNDQFSKLDMFADSFVPEDNYYHSSSNVSLSDSDILFDKNSHQSLIRDLGETSFRFKRNIQWSLAPLMMSGKEENLNGSSLKKLIVFEIEEQKRVFNETHERNVFVVKSLTDEESDSSENERISFNDSRGPLSHLLLDGKEEESSKSDYESMIRLLKDKLRDYKRQKPLESFHLTRLNTTHSSSSDSEKQILSLLSKMVEELKEKENLISSISPNSEVLKLNKEIFQPDSLCRDTSDYKILPKDSQKVARRKQASLIRCYMNVSVDPCEDFYEYACGNWALFNPIPRDKGSYNIFEILREDLDAKLIRILEQPILIEENNATKAVKMLYKSCMNMERIEKLSEEPLLRLIKTFGGWPVLMGSKWNAESDYNWQQTITKLRAFNNDILISVWVGPDGKKSDENIVQFDQSDLHLPSFDYYKLGLNNAVMQTYLQFLVDVALLLGAEKKNAKTEMLDLLQFEIKLAEIMIPPADRRNYSEMYQKMTLEDLEKEVPIFDFGSYLKDLLPRPLNDSEYVVVYALPYFKKLTTLLEETPSRVTANYILWRFIRHRINNLDSRFHKAQKEIYLKLSGREETPPRWKFCVQYVNGNLGYSVGSLFVKKYFDQQSKRDMESLTSEVQEMFRKLVLSGAWLSNSTKKLAEKKIKSIIHNIGYPDFILQDEQLQEEVEGLNYTEDAFFDNVLLNLQYRTIKEMSNFGQKVNRSIWTITPAVVNAYYSRNKNQIMFPAGILQPPFYHKHFPKSMNFGGIGVVIGHEITHGFDDKGRQFDEVGNIHRWWDYESSQNFHEKAQCIIDQYSNFMVEEIGVYLNGWNSQGENIADNGGIKEAFMAYKNYMYHHGENEESLPGLEAFSHDQLFFLNFAQVWCGSTRTEALRSKVRSAVHAPGKYRVQGTLSNSIEFAEAFKCSDKSKMNPTDKCSVW